MISYWLIVVGILTGLLAAVFGLIDWLSIPPDTRAKRIGRYHGVGNVVVVGLVAASWFTGCLGGEMVDRLGVGVDEGAHLNASSSLSGEPAGDDAARANTGARAPAGRR